MTEKLLFYGGGALQQAGVVQQKAEQGATASDFMENRPCHQDFSEVVMDVTVPLLVRLRLRLSALSSY